MMDDLTTGLSDWWTYKNRLDSENIYYRPQTKLAMVMFLRVSVCPQEGVCVAGETTTEAGSAQPTGIHSCLKFLP